MPTNNIPVNIEKPWGRRLVSWRDKVRDVVDELDEIRGKMLAMTVNDDRTELEEQFGLEPGDGYAAWYQLDSLYGKLSSNTDVQALNDTINQIIDFIG